MLALHWREHAAASNAAGCGANAAFVTFVSGDRYVPGAVCLRRSIAGAGNRCPMDVVYDDRLPERNLSADSFALLANTFGTERVFSLARIMADHPTSIADMHYSAPSARVGRRGRGLFETRRLFERGPEHMATHAKLWLWGLPRSRSVVLDSDMVVRGALDWLLTFDLDEHEVAAAGAVRKGALSFFNSGLMIIRPGAALLHNLTRVAMMARSGTVLDSRGDARTPANVGEKIFGDQSLLNLYFGPRWKSLPTATVVAASNRVNINAESLMASDPAVIHFLSEPKPWSRAALRIDAVSRQPLATAPSSAHAKLWWQLCGDKLGDLPVKALGR